MTLLDKGAAPSGAAPLSARPEPRVAAVWTLLGAVAYGCVAHGGFRPTEQRVLLALVAAAAVLACWADRGHGGRAWRAPVALAAPFAAWSLVAAGAAGDLAGAAPVLGILGAVVGAVIVGRVAGADRDDLVDGLLFIGVGVALLGWVGVVARWEPLGLLEAGLWRAASTITYENATAALLAPLALLALGRACARPERRSDGLLTFALIVGLGATLSRAGVLGFAVGLAVLAWRTPWRRLLDVVAPIFTGAVVALAGVVAASPAQSHGRAPFAVAALLTGAGLCAWLPRRRVVVLAVAGAALVCAAAVLAVGAPGVRAGRLSADSPDRDGEWRASAHVVSEHPLTGVGPSQLELVWTDADGQVRAAHATHNEYLQLAAEQGVVAAAFALVALALVARAIRRAEPSTTDWLTAAALAGLAAFAVHSAFDFVWHVPVVPVVVAAVVGLSTPPSRAGPSRVTPRAPRASR